VELVRGVLVVREPPGYSHGRVTAALAARLHTHLGRAGTDQDLVVESGFTLARDPDTVRGPDIAVVSRARVPGPAPRGFPELAPDLVVEVRSPGARAGEVLAKVADWLTAGTRLVWVVDPDRRLARVYRQDGTETVVTEHEALDGEDVVPEFACPLGTIL
jgi:Uma2 family endonuclease